MRRTPITLSAALALALAAGCSSMGDSPSSSPSGTIGSDPYSASSATSSSEAAQFGYVRDITPQEASRRTSGVGAILGAVAGGVVGNQVGSGTGRAAATGLGAVGGAIAGNKIEESRNAGSGQSYYRVDVRLDNGDTRSFDYYDVNGLRVGDRVRVVGEELQRW